MAERVTSGSEPADRARRVVAVGMAVLTVVGVVAAWQWRPHPVTGSGGLVRAIAELLVVMAAGLTVAWLRQRSWIGWLLLLAALLQTVSLAGEAFARVGYGDGQGSPLAYLAAWLATWTWFPSITLPVAVLPSIYPSGRPESRLRRLFTWAGVVGITAMSIELGLVLGPTDIVVGLRLPYTAPDWVGTALVVVAAGGLGVAVLGGLAEAAVRMVRSGTPERQQLAWLLAPLAVSPSIYFFSWPSWFPGYAAVGTAVAVGVLRYRLLDITVVVRRTLFYAPLIAAVALAVAVVSTAVARVTPSGPLPLLGAAAVVGVLVGPVSSGLRRLVDRLVLGARADPLSAVAGVAAHGKLEARDDPLRSLLEALVGAVDVGYAAVVDRAGCCLAAVGDEAPVIVRLELCEAGDPLGELLVEEPPDPAGARIVVALTPHVASVVRALTLTADLETERRRALTATVAERHRIRSDLHDSLGPALSGISLSLQAVDSAMSGDQATARTILGRARDEADAAVREVRRVLDALGPAALDRHDLAEAIQQTADRLGFGEGDGPAFAFAQRDVASLPPEVAEAALLITGEALHNVARHSGASRCEVRLLCRDGALELCVIDDGVGIVGSPAQGLGLDSMHRRAESSGGTCAISSRPVTNGTLLQVRLPLEVGA